MKVVTFGIKMLAYDEHVTTESLQKMVESLMNVEPRLDMASPGCEVLQVSIEELETLKEQEYLKREELV